MKLIISLCMLLATSAFADHHTGFKNGNDISIVTLNGHVRVSCYNPPAWANYNCWDEIVTPGSFDSFVMAEPVDADKVTLSVTKKNGKVVSKTEKYNSKKNVSKDFNIAVNTLLQRSLLELGTNTVEYSLTKKGQEVARGSFVATVTVTEERQCRYRHMIGNHDDCRNAASACNDYFYSENFCKY